jgi:enoyl-CoA hydratase/carnithine racemase
METIVLERKGSVAWVWLNRPRRLNTMNPAMFRELHQTFEELDGDGAVNAIVLAGRGQAFSAGFDVAWMVGLRPETVARDIGSVHAVYDSIEACAKPLIVAVHGPAVGGGLLLALVADFVLASAGASFGAPEVKLGFFPPLELIPRLERRVGLGAAKRIVLTGELFDAAEAQRIGLVERVVEADALYEQAQGLAEQLAALPPIGVQLAKRAFAAAQRDGYRAWETAQLATCWSAPERAAAMEAFLKQSQG